MAATLYILTRQGVWSLKHSSFSQKCPLFQPQNTVKILVFPHFDYAALIYMDVDLTRWQELQIAHNACVRLVIGSIPFIPTSEIISHVTHWRLKLGWFSLACRMHLQLIFVFYYIQCRKEPERLFDKIKLPDNLPRHSLRLPLAFFEYDVPRIHAWDSSFTISGKRLSNRLSITEFDP